MWCKQSKHSGGSSNSGTVEHSYRESERGISTCKNASEKRHSDTSQKCGPPWFVSRKPRRLSLEKRWTSHALSSNRHTLINSLYVQKGSECWLIGAAMIRIGGSREKVERCLRIVYASSHTRTFCIIHLSAADFIISGFLLIFMRAPFSVSEQPHHHCLFRCAIRFSFWL
jgi:hypothetical protein